jgi:ABC-type sugar transport system ATPase subunit
MASVELRNVSKSFGSALVIREVNLSIDDGELTVFVGPSGSGKSTLLRLIAGLEQITSGDILINHVRVNDFEPAERRVSMVFQSCALYPHMTVERNIGFGLSMTGRPKAEVSARVQEVADILKLSSVDNLGPPLSTLHMTRPKP